VVRVGVGQDDVGHGRGSEAEGLDPPRRGLISWNWNPAASISGCPIRPERVAHVEPADAGVHEREAGRVLQ
jgi:hypothetical protein